jgi:ornithine cyclodeaminase
MNTQLPYIDADGVFGLVSPRAAVEILLQALRDGYQPAKDFPRVGYPMTHGELATMPSEIGSEAGIKIVNMVPGNLAKGLAFIQSVYLLFDGETLAPKAAMDGAALTALRTPAVSLAGLAGPLLERPGALRAGIYGTGVQGRRHAITLADFLAGRREIAQLTFVTVTDPITDFPPGWDIPVATTAPGSEVERNALQEADLVICCTPSPTPLFDSALLRDDVLVVAMGSHHPDRREIDSQFMGRAQVIVEDVQTALREPGDVILAIADGALAAADLIELSAVARGEVKYAPSGPIMYKTVGMGWEDLAVASRIYQSWKAAQQ